MIIIIKIEAIEKGVVKFKLRHGEMKTSLECVSFLTFKLNNKYIIIYLWKQFKVKLYVPLPPSPHVLKMQKCKEQKPV